MIAAIIQARMTSRRLPGKVLLQLAGKSILEHIHERMCRISSVDKVIFATTAQEHNMPIIREAERLGAGWATGDEYDCLQRFSIAADKYGVHHFVRVTADNPLTCPKNIAWMIASHIDKDADVTYTDHMPEGLGLGMIVMSRQALAKCNAEATDPYHREYIDEYPLAYPELFRMNVLQAPANLRRPYRLTVDEPTDFALMTRIFETLYPARNYVRLEDVIAMLDADPALAQSNMHVIQET